MTRGGPFTRWVRFTATGTAGLIVQVVALTLLISFAGVQYLIATAVAVEMGILFNYMWHERWTWRDHPAASIRERWIRLARFNALTAVTSIAGTVILTAAFVQIAGIPPLAANIASVTVLGMLNFAGAHTWVFRAAVMSALIATATGAAAADSLEATLQAKTAKDFARYVATVEARRTREVDENGPFLDFERQAPAQQAQIMAALRRGEVIVTRAEARDDSSRAIPIDGGLVNHWRGTILVPNVTLDTLLKTLQEPQSDKHKQEDVLSSRVISRDGDSQKVFLRLRRTKFVTVVYDTEYDVTYSRLAPDRALSNSISTRIVEIENAGTPRERALPEGNDHGYMWRLNSYWRYKQVDGGVLVEIESLTLSRSLPLIVGPLIRPIVNNTARESMTRTLASVRARFAS